MKITLPLEVRFFVWLLSLLAVIFFTEEMSTRFLGAQTLSPLLSVICIGLLGFLFPWRLVLFSVPFFATLSFFLIQDASNYPLVRSSTVIVAGVLATWASWHKERLHRQMREFDVVIRNLPLPWILSDPNGNVLQASTSLAALAGKSQEELAGMSRFAVLSASAEEFDQPKKDPGNLRSEFLQIHPFFLNRSTKVFRATYLPVVVQNDHCLLTILKDS